MEPQAPQVCGFQATDVSRRLRFFELIKMFLFWPLPVTPDYKRTGEKVSESRTYRPFLKIPAQKTIIVEKELKPITLFWPLPVIPNTEHFGTIKVQGEKFRKVEQIQKGRQIRKFNEIQVPEGCLLSVWDILQYETHPLLSIAPAFLVGLSKVSLFHVSNTRRRDVELTNAFNHFVLLTQRLKTTLPRIQHLQEQYYNMPSIMKRYRQLDLNGHITTENKSAMFFTEGFGKWFMKSMKFIRLNIVPVLPVMSREDININNVPSLLSPPSIYSSCSVLDRYGVSNSRWLTLMSWWKGVQSKLIPDYSELVDFLKARDELCSSEDVYNIKDRMHKLTNTLQDLNLDEAPAEFIAVNINLEIVRILLNPCFFKLSEYKTKQMPFNSSFVFDSAYLHSAVEEDSRWVIFITEIGQLAIHVVSVVIDIAKCIPSEQKIVKELERRISVHVEDFYDIGVRFCSAQIRRKSAVDAIVTKISDAVISPITRLKNLSSDKTAKMAKGTSEEFLKLPSEFVCHLLDDVVKAIANSALRSIYQTSDDRERAVSVTLSHLKDIKYNAILLSHKCFCKDFMSLDILQQIKVQSIGLTSKFAYLSSCAQVAYCIITVLEVSYGPLETLKRVIVLPFDYCQQDFISFVQEVCLVMEPLSPMSEILHSIYYRQLNRFMKNLNKELLESLDKITAVGNAAVLLLDTANNLNNECKNEYL